jgi:hypothetical protein
VDALITESTPWTQTEFEQLELGDARLNKRARLLMQRLAADPMASVPKACRGWGETMAAYRFFDNEKVEWHAILEPHWQHTQKRMAAHRVVLCLQDTTELDFNAQGAFGLGPLSYEAQRGMYLHPTYAVTPQREPLGILDAWMWAREKKDESGKRGGLKESLRWIEGYERIAEMAPSLPSTRLVYVADREADLMALMERAQALDTPADWLVRATHNRCLPEGDKLWERTTRGEAIGQITFTMASRHGAHGAPATVDAACGVTRRPRQVCRGHLSGRTRVRRSCGRQADRMALADQPRGDDVGRGDRIDRLVSSALGNRDVVQHLEECLPRRGASVGLDPTA